MDLQAQLRHPLLAWGSLALTGSPLTLLRLDQRRLTALIDQRAAAKKKKKKKKRKKKGQAGRQGDAL